MKTLLKSLFIVTALTAGGYAASAQGTETTTNMEGSEADTVASDVEDTTDAFMGYMNPGLLKESKPFTLPSVKNTNVVFYKRVWREIDLSDTANAIFKTPGSSLVEAIVDGIRTGKLKAYDATPTLKDPTGESFKTVLRPAEAMAKLSGDSVTIEIVGDDGEIKGSQRVLNDFNPETIKKYRIIEDVFYDRNRSRIETRIIGLAPLKDVNIASDITILNPGAIPGGGGIPATGDAGASAYNGGIPDGNQNTPTPAADPTPYGADAPATKDLEVNSMVNPSVAGATQALFWLNYPQARRVFATKEVTDPSRDKNVLSYDDIFIRHSFKSTVVRESNPAKGNTSERLSATESQRVEKELQEFRDKTWDYKK